MMESSSLPLGLLPTLVPAEDTHVAPAVKDGAAEDMTNMAHTLSSAETTADERSPDTTSELSTDSLERSGPPETISPKSALSTPLTTTGGLAARRKVTAGLGVRIEKEKDMSKGDAIVEKLDKTEHKIKVVEDARVFYKLGKEVMPSSNTGMDVLFATRISDGKEVVIKTRRKSNSFTSKNEQQEWRRSTEMLMNLPGSENIAQIHETLEDKTTYYIVMEKVEGMDLFEVLQGEGRIPMGEVKAILRQLLRAVQDLHARGCIHKDLKLENVMVDKAPSPGVKSSASIKSSGSGKSTGRISFGLGKKDSSPSEAHEEPPESPTVVKLIDFDTVETFSPKARAKSVVGTDQYIAPEAYAGHYSPTSDIFSVGVIAYRLISGRFPFKNSMFDDEPGENWVGSPKMKVIQDRLKHFHIDFSTAPWPAEPKARELVRWMLATNEKERPTAKQCLQHAFFEVTGQTPALPQGPWGSRAQRQS